MEEVGGKVKLEVGKLLTSNSFVTYTELVQVRQVAGSRKAHEALGVLDWVLKASLLLWSKAADHLAQRGEGELDRLTGILISRIGKHRH